jgi:hypothetical protein
MFIVFSFITAFGNYLSPIMYGASWAPLVIAIYAIRTDSIQELSEEFQSLRQSFPYLSFYLVLIDLFPDLCGSILSLFFNLENDFIRFGAKIVFLVFVTLVKLLSKRVILFCGRTDSFQLQLLAPIQYLQAFFELMIFISLSLDNLSFWFLLVLQTCTNGLSNSLGIIRSAEYTIEKIRNVFFGTQLQPRDDSKVQTKNILDLIRTRSLICSKIQEMLQMIIVDTVAISSIVALYYAYVYFLLGNSGELSAQIYSYYFGIRTKEQLYSAVLLAQFTVIFVFRMLGNLFPLVYLNGKIKRFQKKYLN